tara:strand:+ start:517 stop:963 length:447 start_codon:yes stop_codon:yes gene_type:complete
MTKYITILLAMFLVLPVVADDHKHKKAKAKAKRAFEPLADLFVMADKDKDGTISYLEHEDFISMQAEKGRERFAELDADNDNSVSSAEAKAFAKRKIREMMGKRKEIAEKIRKESNGDRMRERERYEEYRRAEEMKNKKKKNLSESLN